MEKSKAAAHQLHTKDLDYHRHSPHPETTHFNAFHLIRLICRNLHIVRCGEAH